jgi:putative DNA primase/helicase
MSATETGTNAVATGAPPAFRKNTDLGNAERMADRATGRLLWVYGMGWLYWDGTRWRRDESNRILREAADTVRSIYGEAAIFADQAATQATDESERKKWGELSAASASWARKSEGGSRIAAAVKLATAQPRLVLDEGAEALDPDPNALNVANGTLDLTTFELRPHDPADHHTRVTGAAYRPEATAPFFLETVAKALPDPEIRRWVQKAVGYSVSGDFAEYLFILHGEGANLKSTFEFAVRNALGDYSVEAPSDLLVARREWGAGGESALAGLHGRRFVTATETEQGKALAEVLAKKLSGEPQITAKFMRQDYFTFKNQTAVWLATNYKPVIQGMDYAMWRRIKLVPFVQTIAPQDRLGQGDVQERLRAEADGVLSWIVEGRRLYLAEGLDPAPAAVEEATVAYQREMDPLADWLEAAFEDDATGVVPIREVRRSYNEYCKLSGRHPLGDKRFNELMEARGYVRPKTPATFTEKDGSTARLKAWRGIRYRLPG